MANEMPLHGAECGPSTRYNRFLVNRLPHGIITQGGCTSEAQSEACNETMTMMIGGQLAHQFITFNKEIARHERHSAELVSRSADLFIALADLGLVGQESCHNVQGRKRR